MDHFVNKYKLYNILIERIIKLDIEEDLFKWHMNYANKKKQDLDHGFCMVYLSTKKNSNQQVYITKI